MPSNFKIVRTSEGVWGREVNPYKKPEMVAYDFSEPQNYHRDYRRWLLAVSQLQEYPLTDQSENKFLYLNSSDNLIGQIISGELVTEAGVKKIKV